MDKILLVGNDLRLLMTRSAVLARTAATIVNCNAAEAAGLLQGESFNLIVLCHSLTESQTSEITEMTHLAQRTATVLRVVSDISEELPQSSTVLYATSTSDPEVLIRRTSELLRQTSTSMM